MLESSRGRMNSQLRSDKTSSMLSPKQKLKKAKTYEMPDGADSFNVVQAALDAVFTSANHEITWLELKKFKLSYATKNIRILAKRVTELHFMKPDARNDERTEIDEMGGEPVAAKADNAAPYLAKVNFRPPPIPSINLGNAGLDKFKLKTKKKKHLGL